MSEVGRYFAYFLSEKEETDYPVKNKFYNGILIQVENPAGSVRRGKNEDGTSWETTMLCDYGRVFGTNGRDGDMLDVFVNSDKMGFVYCIFQNNPKTGFFDEHKYMLGFDDSADAIETYLKHYDSPHYYGGYSQMSFDDFKKMTLYNSMENAYNDALKSGMFFEFHSELSGNWAEDISKWAKIYLEKYGKKD